MERADFDARVAGIAVLDQPLRRDLYELLVQRGGWLGRDEAAAALGIARSVAAFHLDKLAEVGLVDVRFERPAGRSGPGAGRPAKRYRRSESEVYVSLPDRRYDLAGAVLADAVDLAMTAGEPVESTLAEAARRTGAAVGTAMRAKGRPDGSAPGPEGSLASARAAVVDALRRLGYEPRESGGDVVLANCPFHGLAERHRTLVCGMNLDLLTGLVEALGTDDRLAPALEPAEGMCCVRLRPR